MIKVCMYMIQLTTGASPESIRGIPDAVITLTQVDAKGREDTYGFSLRHDASHGGHAVIKAVHASQMTVNLKDPDRLHHYWTSHIMAHHIGHILSLKDAEANSSCNKSYGTCIMSSEDVWRSPFLQERNVDFIRDSVKLGGVNEFLMETNVREYETSSTTYIKKGMTARMRAVMWTLLILSLIFAAAAVLLLWSSRIKGEAVQVVTRESIKRRSVKSAGRNRGRHFTVDEEMD